ncbi:MAG TPA: SDR family NAD(P)-dependent oxidoreductase [Candidatus Acidoferrales bacterium]|nr:SDR family NAD(P)-dependent oxidoreductase [Candidatus Acidoferrales bacterium]
MERLDGKVALITGASRGIGKAIAQAYARAGAKVVLCARGKPDLEAAATEIESAGGAVSWKVADLAKPRQAQGVVRFAVKVYGALHILVNNASVLGPRAPIVDYPLAAWEEVIRCNLTGPFVLCKEALKIMIPSGEGSIINVSSGVGRVGRGRWGAYAASKFGLEGLTQVLADELKDKNIRVNAVNPGATRTAMRAQAYPDEDPQTLPKPEAITGVFLYLASDSSRNVTGQSLDARDWIANSR